MNEFDWSAVRRDKEASRERRANLSYSEKLKMLDRLRERSLAMKGRAAEQSASGVRGTKPTGAQRKK